MADGENTAEQGAELEGKASFAGKFFQTSQKMIKPGRRLDKPAEKPPGDELNNKSQLVHGVQIYEVGGQGSALEPAADIDRKTICRQFFRPGFQFWSQKTQVVDERSAGLIKRPSVEIRAAARLQKLHFNPLVCGKAHFTLEKFFLAPFPPESRPTGRDKKRPQATGLQFPCRGFHGRHHHPQLVERGESMTGAELRKKADESGLKIGCV